MGVNSKVGVGVRIDSEFHPHGGGVYETTYGPSVLMGTQKERLVCFIKTLPQNSSF